MSRYSGRPPRGFKVEANVITSSKNFRDQCDIDEKQVEKCEILRNQGNMYLLGIPLGGPHIALGF